MSEALTKEQIEKARLDFEDGIPVEYPIRIALCRMALRSVEPSDEPVAWTTKLALEYMNGIPIGFEAAPCNLWGDKGVPLYAHPPRQAVPRYLARRGMKPDGTLPLADDDETPRQVSDERIAAISFVAAQNIRRLSAKDDIGSVVSEAIRTALRESGDAKDARRIEGLEPPFSVYEDYERGLHIIDRTTRIVLSDSYAYDKDEAARASRMEAIAAALNAALSGATHD